MEVTGRPMFFLRTLLWAWSIPLALLALPVATFHMADSFWMLVSLATLVAVWIACWLGEGSAGWRFNRVGSWTIPPAAQCRQVALLFSLLTCVGSALVLVDQQRTLADFQFENLQQKYLAIVELSNSGERTGTLLSTLGNALRAFVYLAISAFVALTAQPRRAWSAVVPCMAVVAAMLLSSVATASRTYLLFCALTAVMAGLLVRHPVFRRPLILAAAVFAGTGYLLATTNQRFDATMGDQAILVDYLTAFFEVDLHSLGDSIYQHFGAAALTATLYVSHSLPEFSRLVADGSTHYELGAHSFYHIVEPLLRLFGIELAPRVDRIERPGMWWGSFGDLYLDFGPAFIIAYPIMVFLMVRAAKRISRGTVYGLGLQSLTAAMLFASPFFGVMNTFSFSYLGLLTLAWLHPTDVRRPAAAVPLGTIEGRPR